jgi:hypothetical protein
MKMINGTTQTGLDLLIDLIVADEGLAARISQAEIEAGAIAANKMNEIIVKGIQATGIANDGKFTAADMRTLSDWVRATHLAEFTEYHGNDEGNVETGFHLIQNDGDATKLFGRDLVDTVADGLYHLVFGYEKNNIINEDGNRNAQLDELSWWLGELLEEELVEAAAGTGPLANAGVDPKAVETSGSGLDQLVDIILDDPGLSHKISASEIQEGAQAAADLNTMIVNIIKSEGLANDGKITASDVYRINAVIQGDDALHDRFLELHGNDEDGVETGFHLVQGDGANTRIFSTNAVNTLADGIYHIGFDIEKGRFLNEDGDRNASVTTVASWIDGLLHGDYKSASLMTAEADPIPDPATGTGLDDLIDMIEADPSLERRIDVADIGDGVAAANTMNALLLEGLKATGAANDGVIQTSDMRDVNTWLRADADRYQTFLEAHGNDENGVETGFHLVQGDGAVSRLYGENGVNTVADGIYHFGFDIDRGRFLNEDGDKNQSVEKVAAWVNELLTDDDKAALVNADVVTSVTGSTGTGLDRFVDIIMSDPGLNDDISTSDTVAGAQAADGLNALIVEGLIAVGAGQDGTINAADVAAVSAWIREDAGRYEAFVELHGNDEGNVETGFHLVQGDGADTHLFDRNAVNTVADGIYHIGFEIKNGRFLNEDGNANASVSSVAHYLNALMADDLANGVLYNPAYDPANVDVAALDAGLVRSLDEVVADGQTGSVELAHDTDLNLSQTTVMFSMTANSTDGMDGLFSKDGKGLQDGGHVTIFRSGDDIKVRVQTDTSEVWLVEKDVVEAGQPLHVALTLDGTAARLYLDGALVEMKETSATWANADEDITVGANAWAQTDADDNRVRDVFDGTINDVKVYDTALTGTQIQAVGDVRPTVETAEGLEDRGPLPSGTTGTGLDRLVEIITSDVGLDRRISDEEIAAGAEAANVMNGLIIEAIQATGVANDGTLSAGDIRDMSTWVMMNRKEAFLEAHGDDEGNIETGFHLVQNDGAKTRIFGDNAVDTVADGLYHLPFGYRKDRIINEDGNNNQTLEDLAWWSEALLADELAEAAQGQGVLFNADENPRAVALTGTGLDQIIDIIFTDIGINKNVATSDAQEAAEAATGISTMILDAIREQGLVDDGDLTASDVYAINSYIRENPDLLEQFITFHGNDENGVETGYHLVQNNGGQTFLFSKNALDTVADGLFHIGFDIVKGRFQNEDGDNNASVETVAYWLEQMLSDDIDSGALDSELEAVAGTTGTGLDSLVDIVMTDPGLQKRISELDIREGAEAADAINAMIVEAIEMTGVAANGEIKRSDIYEINDYIRANHYDAFVEAHGNDENGVETGFHLVQGDGANTVLFSNNAVNTVADGLYHIGFEIDECGRLTNEDGNANVSITTAAGWLDSLLTAADYQRLSDAAVVNPYIMGTTGTGLDQLVNIVTSDDGLINRISTSDIRDGAEAAQGMNELILDAIRDTGVANDGSISAYDVLAINDVIRGDASALATFTELHGNDEQGVETGFHLVQGDGARTELFERNAVNTVADGIYHIGFEVKNNRFVNEDGDANASVSTVAGWLDDLLADDLADGSLVNPDLLPEAVDLAALQQAEVRSMEAPFEVTKEGGAVELADGSDLDLAAATVIVGFTADNAQDAGKDVFFSRDGAYYQDGGHLSMWVEKGDLVARFQTAEDQVYLKANDVIEDGTAYDVAFTFNGSEAQLYLDGAIVDIEASTATWENADEAILLGGSLMQRRDGQDRVDDRFEGTIDDFFIFNRELNFAEIQAATQQDYGVLV